MTDADQLESILGAVTKAIVGAGPELVIDLSKLEEGLVAAGLECTATTHRGALTTELTFIREERRVMCARRDNAEGYDRQEFEDIVKRIDAREEEITALLWR